jgi:hypothetical protein
MIDGDVLKIFTEICKDNFEEALCAPPHYTRHGEPWYYWAMIEWFNSETTLYQNIPRKLLLFYRLQDTALKCGPLFIVVDMKHSRRVYLSLPKSALVMNLVSSPVPPIAVFLLSNVLWWIQYPME